jgi:hypothetical protein
MALSGIGDTAEVLYYSNVNYNSGLQPKTSYIIQNLQSQFLQNQTNYEVGINKLKLSSLENVRLGTLPPSTWQLGLKISGTNGIPYEVASYVNTPGNLPIIRNDEYYAYVDASTYAIFIMKQVQGVDTNPIQILTFKPIDNYGDNLFCTNVFYDILANVIWATTDNNIYLFNSTTGIYINSVAAFGTISASFFQDAAPAPSGQLIITQISGSPAGPTPFSGVLIYNTFGAGAISQVGTTITKTFANTDFTFISCACRDASTVLICWGYNNVSVYDASGLAFVATKDESFASVQNIQSCSIDSKTNTIFLIDSLYIPAIIGMNSNTPGDLYNVYTQTQIKNSTDTSLITTIASFPTYTFGSSVNPQAIALASATALSALTSTSVFGAYSSGVQPTYLTDYTFPSNSLTPQIQVVLGYQVLPGGAFNLICQGAGNQYLIVSPTYNLGHANGMFVSVDWQGYVWLSAIDGTGVYKGDKLPTITPSTAPFLQFPSNMTFQPQQFRIGGLILTTGISGVCFDPFLQGKMYCIFDFAINSGYYNPILNAWQLTQYMSSTTQSYYQYLYLPPRNGYTIGAYQYSIDSFNYLTSNINKTTSYINEILSSIYYNETLAKLVCVNQTTNAIEKLNPLTLALITSYSVAPNEIVNIGYSTGKQTIQPPQTGSAVYDMETFILAFNAALASCYAQLVLLVPGTIPIPTAPYFTLDYTTHLLTLNYDNLYSLPANGIFVNAELLRYALFPNKPAADTDLLPYEYILQTPGTSMTQSKETMYLLNQVDKLIIKTNMSVLADFTGTDTSTTIFTDLDFDTQGAFFNMTGNFIYSAILLRNYVMVSNQTLRNISYQFFIQYVDGSEEEYLIPLGQNVSIKFQFTRIY